MQLEVAIPVISHDLHDALQAKIDQKTKPLGALGRLEQLALQIGLIQNSLSPVLNEPSILIFAGDHGIVSSGVSAYPQAVTAQMVANFLSGGAAITVFARQHQLALLVVDAGVNADFTGENDNFANAMMDLPPQFIDAKIAKGTQNFVHAAAMTDRQCDKAINTGAELVLLRHDTGCNCIGVGEMGIGNTSAAAMIMSRLTGLNLAQCVGKGTGLSERQLQHKLTVLQQADAFHAGIIEPLAVLATFGGFEIAMMVGAFLKAAELGMLILIDGFIASAALLVAFLLKPQILDYCIFSHVSSESGHRALLEFMNAKPLLDLGLRLGEGSAIALAYPLIQSAVCFINEMASFEEAGVAQKQI